MSSAQDDHFRFGGAKGIGQEPLTADSLDENLTSVIITVTTRMNSQALWENLQKVFDVFSEETCMSNPAVHVHVVGPYGRMHIFYAQSRSLLRSFASFSQRHLSLLPLT